MPEKSVEDYAVIWCWGAYSTCLLPMECWGWKVISQFYYWLKIKIGSIFHSSLGRCKTIFLSLGDAFDIGIHSFWNVSFKTHNENAFWHVFISILANNILHGHILQFCCSSVILEYENTTDREDKFFTLACLYLTRDRLTSIGGC
jgi:hypothetical protein